MSVFFLSVTLGTGLARSRFLNEARFSDLLAGDAERPKDGRRRRPALLRRRRAPRQLDAQQPARRREERPVEQSVICGGSLDRRPTWRGDTERNI